MTVKITNVERLTLLNQFKILNSIIPQKDQDLDYAYFIEVLENGYEHEYANVFQKSMAEAMSEEESEFVWQVLNAHRHILLSFHKLQKSGSLEKLEEDDVMFKGFDGNEDGGHLLYCDFIINKMGRFEEFRGYDLNTHSSILSRYRDLLRRFDSFPAESRLNLSEQDIMYILNKK